MKNKTTKKGVANTHTYTYMCVGMWYVYVSFLKISAKEICEE